MYQRNIGSPMSAQLETTEPRPRRPPHTFGWTFLAACTALLAIAAVHYYSVYRSERVRRETAEQANVELVRQAMVADVAAVVTDLMVLARHIEQMPFADNTIEVRRELQRVFVIFAEQKRLYDQIRFIDASGRETLRVNLVGDRARSVPSSQLQDKSDRYYFTETLMLTPGDIYISPLDLNVEQGRIEQPFKPVMRFATPIFDDRGGKAGIVVLNYLGQRLLDAVQRAAGLMSDRLHLLGPRGYWLRSPNPSDAWGLMLGTDRAFWSELPNEWQRIAQHRRGQLLTANGLFTFATVSPHPVAHAAVRSARVDLASPTESRESPYAWRIVAHLPLRDLVPSPGRFLAGHIALYSAMLALLAIGSFLLARARVHHHQAEMQSDYERRFRRTLEDIQLAAVALDRSGRITFCNRFFLQLTDWNRTRVVGKPWLERFTPEENRERMAALLRTLDTPEQFPPRYTSEVLTRSGERRLLAWHNSLNTDADGRPIGVTAIGEDITEKRRNESALRKLSQAVEQSPSIVTITDRSGLIEYVNPKFTEVTGYTMKEVEGQNPRILKSGETQAGEYAELWRTVSAGGEWRGEFHNRRKNGELYWESASISALRDAEGRITHYLAVKEDITERKRLEQEVELRNRELARSQALAEVGRMATMIAHDLRNPLSSVKIALQILSKQEAPSGESQELRAIAREQVAYMEAILSDMLAFASPQAPSLEWLSADKLLQTVVGLTQRRLDDRRVTLDTRYQSGLPTFPGDPNQLRQVFSNLMINAIQATEDLADCEGRVLIRTGLELGSEGTRIRIDICDNGRGIQEANAARLFEPFFTTRAKGTGLGLAIVRKILDQHHGSIRLHPNTSRGTCAMVSLPTVPEGRNATPTEKPVAWVGS
jgi:PAS domain S-box-containing protein